jgi:hypothetical protein
VSGRIVIAGAIAQKPGCAGHAWQFLQYLLGFRRLGWDVCFIDQIGGADPVAGRRYVGDVMAWAGLEGDWSLGLRDGERAGLGRAQVLERIRDADLLLNVMGFETDPELLGAARLRVFLDTDPGFGQMWHALGLADIFAGHDAHVTIAERIGAPDCTVPTCGLDWITTPQPVVLDAWPVAAAAPGGAFTSVASWRGAYGPIDFDGHRYGLRAHQLRRFAKLPAAAPGRFELALDIHAADAADAELLRAGGWHLRPPAEVAATPDGYRAYLRGSAGEVMVAKGMYVDSRSGWFSERSTCYLASGRPVLAQDTGLADLYPVGEGLLVFSTLAEAIAGAEELRADPARHAAAARALAEERFDSDRVLGRLLDRLSVSA